MLDNLVSSKYQFTKASVGTFIKETRQKIMRFHFIFLLPFLLLSSLLCTSVNGEEEEKTSKVVFTTFDNSGAASYAYLRDSIQNMIKARLATQRQISVVDKVLTTNQLRELERGKDFRSLRSALDDIDYIVDGAIFETTAGLTVQVSLYPLNPEIESSHFTSLSSSEEEILANVEKLVAEIADRGFGVDTAATAVAGSQDLSGFTTEHPEKLYKKRLYTGTVYGTEFAKFTVAAKGAKKRQTINGEIISMAVADIDGQPGEEIVTIDETRLAIFRLNGRLIEKVTEKQLSRRLRLHALSLGDIDKDGRAEIVISATDGLDVSSMILRWNAAGGFQTLAENLRYYLRAVDLPAKGETLCGQRRGQAKIDLIRPGVSVLVLDAQGKLQMVEALPVPEKVNLFDFSYADLDGDGYHEMVVVDQREKLKVYSPSNQLMWVSTGQYGGSRVYLGPSQGTSTDEQDRNNFTTNEDRDRELIYVPARTVISDMDGDGRDEVVVSAGKMSAIGFFNRLRPYSFTSGTVKGMIWHEGELVEVWSTGNYRGYLADFSFELNKGSEGDQQPPANALANGSLFVANIPSSGTFASMLPGKADSQLSVYALAFTKAEETPVE